jgi:steroid 5-alpha reductase family enzyme
MALNGVGVALAAVLLVALATWMVSVARRDVSIVDSLWGPMIALAPWAYLVATNQAGPRAALVLTLSSAWALRLAGHITWRNRGHGEDRRYQAIRARNQPNFAFKSLYLVFGLQGLLAWVVTLPLLAAIASPRPLGLLDAAGIAIVLFGIAFESVADWQLARFKADPGNRGRVLDTGLWRHTRHPNYFGEFCVWWGFYAIALAAGGWWAIVAPLLMSVLLLKVSGVTLLEKDIGERRPAYRDYVRRTNAFFPGPRRAAGRKAATS